MTFKDFYISEATSDHSISWKSEKMFVDVINKGRTPFKQSEEVVKQIVKFLDLSGTATWVGSHKDGKLSEYYLDAVKRLNITTSRDRTPKTDIMVNEDKISMKMNKGWIFAHLLEDTSVCFDYTLLNSPNIKEDIKEQIMFILNQLKSKEHKELFSIKDTKIFKDILIDRFRDILNENSYELKKAFIQAGLTGLFKFDKDDKACANKLMVVKFKKDISTKEALQDINHINFDKTRIYDIMNDDAYIKEIAEKSRVTFVIQKTGKLRFDINSIETDGNILTEGIIETIVDLLKQGYEKVKDKIEQIFKYLIDLINKGIHYFMDVLGIAVNVEMNNEIEF